MKKRIAAAALLLAFGGIALFLFQRQAGETYLKSGKRLQEKGYPGAVTLLRHASWYACANPSAHYVLASALQQEAMAASGDAARQRLIEAEAALHNALGIRVSGVALRLLGQNRALEGNFGGALEAYNTAFFLSQKRADAEGWDDLRRFQVEASRDAFARGALGPSLIMAYNHFSGYTPFAPKNAVTELLDSFYKTVPPERWRGATINIEGPTLKTLFASRGNESRRAVTEALRRERFGFLADYLEGA